MKKSVFSFLSASLQPPQQLSLKLDLFNR